MLVSINIITHDIKMARVEAIILAFVYNFNIVDIIEFEVNYMISAHKI